MKAFILSAGLGTRLRPLTEDRPKALVELQGRTLLEWNIRKLKAEGVQELIVNVHHFGQQIIDFLRRHDGFGLPYRISDERELLLDTGGALKQVLPGMEAPLLVYNVDVISSLDTRALFQRQQATGALAVLAVRNRKSSRYLLFDDDLKMAGWKNTKTDEVKWCQGPLERVRPLAFSGMYVVDPDLATFFLEQSVFSIIDTFLTAGKTGRIFGHLHDESSWMDAGKLADLPEVEKLLSQPPYHSA